MVVVEVVVWAGVVVVLILVVMVVVMVVLWIAALVVVVVQFAVVIMVILVIAVAVVVWAMAARGLLEMVALWQVLWQRWRHWKWLWKR